jgi:hypothetical protein
MATRYTDEELHAMEHDPDEWDWDNPIEMPPRSGNGIQIAFHLTGAEVEALSRAAEAAGTTLHRFMLAAALEKAAECTATGSPARS